jgi:hypothetical protein
MIDEEKVCCMCGTTKFIGRINMGDKFYCNACQRKIIEEYGPDYWKPCSFGDFLEKMSDSMGEKGSWKKSNMFSNIKKTLGEIEKDSEEEKL